MQKEKEKTLRIILTFLIILLIFNVVYYIYGKNNQKVTVTNKNFERYEIITTNFLKISDEQLKSYNNLDNEYLLYFGRRTCGSCRDFVPILEKESKKMNIPVYYIDTENMDKPKRELLDSLDIQYVPYVIFFSNYESIHFQGEGLEFEDFLNDIKPKN